jgi:hypothetical protein
MIYLATPPSGVVRDAIAAGHLGQLVTPRGGHRVVPGAAWALDNGCYSDAWREDGWLRGLERYAAVPGCLFAVVPDVVGDAPATDDLWRRWAPIVKSHGFAAAYVLQNGAREIPDDADAVFTGGDNEWKLGRDSLALVREAKARRLWCHMGRVNSARRIAYARSCGYDSVDGTFLAFGPNINLPRLLRWMQSTTTQEMLL